MILCIIIVEVRPVSEESYTRRYYKKIQQESTGGPMGNMNINWEEIGISNDFLFGRIMRDPELCKELLQRILPKLEIDHVEYPELQKGIKPDIDAKSVRLDVYVNDGNNTVYDIEMQTTDSKELPERSRYYQGMIDLQLIDKGQYYKELSRSYVIFICPFDVFGKGRHIYTFENICREEQTLLLQDGTTKIFLNADSQMDDVSGELKAFLDYVAGKKSDDTFVKKLEVAVEEAKKNREWRHEYMTLLMRDQEHEKKGEDKMLALIEKLVDEKRFDDIGKIKENKQYRQELFKEYHII